jgi:hypothetical protein
MRFRPRYTLTTLLLLPVLVGAGIKWYRGPHQYTLEEEREWRRAEMLRASGINFLECGVGRPPPEGTFWAYRNFDGTVTRHGPETSVDPLGHKTVIEYRGGKKHGEHRAWDRTGELYCQGQYENDRPSGEWLYYLGDGVVYRCVRYVHEQGRVVESRFDLGRLSERRVTRAGSNEVHLTAWHSNGQKRVEGRLTAERPDGQWRWWDEGGRQVREARFQDGMPVEVMGRPSLERFMDAALDVSFESAPLQEALDFLNEMGFRTRIVCSKRDSNDVRSRRLTTIDEFSGPAALYLALRDAGLTVDMQADPDGTETLIIQPAEKP